MAGPPIETLLSAEAIKALREEDGPASSLWELLVQRKLATNDQVLGAIAARFRFPVADLAKSDAKLSTTVPEQLARKFNVVPVRQTDSYLEVATAIRSTSMPKRCSPLQPGEKCACCLARPRRSGKNWTRSIGRLRRPWPDS